MNRLLGMIYSGGLLIAGCAGSGSGAKQVLPPSRVVGHWSGTWTQIGLPSRAGTLAIDIAPDGSESSLTANGTVTDTTRGDGAVSGSVVPRTGQTTFMFPYTGPEGALNEIRGGVLSLDARGHLVGTLATYSMGSLNSQATFDLAPAN